MSKQILCIIAAVLTTLTHLSAQKYDCVLLDDISKSSHERNVINVLDSGIISGALIIKFL